jgi:phosphatidylglycerophosphatase A
MKGVVRFLATGFYTGEFPIIPGTWGTLPGLVLCSFWFGIAPVFQAGLAALAIGISIFLSSVAEKDLGHDARPIVVDEIAGMMVALVFVPRVWYYYVLGFLLFRAMDVIKPFPARQAERLPSGLGITMDDVVAGIYANLLLQVVVYFNGVS